VPKITAFAPYAFWVKLMQRRSDIASTFGHVDLPKPLELALHRVEPGVKSAQGSVGEVSHTFFVLPCKWKGLTLSSERVELFSYFGWSHCR
jgi:hypothetical protein